MIKKFKVNSEYLIKIYKKTNYQTIIHNFLFTNGESGCIVNLSFNNFAGTDFTNNAERVA